ncbi:MAG: cytochrome c3 family protein, partial [Planctomycetes bacterium]|nr:cytochrome c3 family protein [Planctomycetota bacterium]
HGGSATSPTALLLSQVEDCKRCHEPGEWKSARPTPEQHATFGFALRGAHAETECGNCHGSATQPARWQGQAPAVAACASCHDHPHQPQLIAAAVARDGTDCTGCHDDSHRAFTDAEMPPALHAATGFALVLPHTDVACKDCHAGDTRALRFPGRDAADCRACHRDVHEAQFDSEPRYGQCTDCHLTTAFHPTQFGIAAHSKTAFPLTGAHDAVACQECHREPQNGARRFRGTPHRCSACHDDVHGGAFDRLGRPATVDGKQDCSRCHDTAAFAPVSTDFDHAMWAGYPLVGAHARTECVACHPTTAATAKVHGRRLGPATGKRCADCHRDPHAGQFAERGATDCRRCHDAEAFDARQFDHDKCRFKLDAAHSPLECTACHKRYDTQGGSVVRYKPLGTTCGDCHKLGSKHGGGK